jgi:uncharacterized membrane protein YesL
MTENPQSQNEQIFPGADPEEPQRPRSLKDRFLNFYYNSIPFFTLNLAWFVMSLPIVTVFPALGGLYYAVLEENQGAGADWRTVWEGFKKHWWLSVRWGLLVVGLDVLLAVNIWFYFNQTQSWAVFLMMTMIVLLFFWIAINQFSFPLLMLQEEKKIGLALRNGYVLVMRQPLQALKVMALSLLIAVISTVLPPLWVFISMALIVNLRTRTAIKAVQRINVKDGTTALTGSNHGENGSTH